MKKFEVKYRLKNQWFYRRIKNLVGDTWLSEFTQKENGSPNPYPARVHVFFTDDGTRYEIPKEGTIFIFSKEREDIIKDQVNNDAGQKII